ncbi:hypothetical protein ACB316_17055 [Aeromonas sanarellii]
MMEALIEELINNLTYLSPKGWGGVTWICCVAVATNNMPMVMTERNGASLVAGDHPPQAVMVCRP